MGSYTGGRKTERVRGTRFFISVVIMWLLCFSMWFYDDIVKYLRYGFQQYWKIYITLLHWLYIITFISYYSVYSFISYRLRLRKPGYNSKLMLWRDYKLKNSLQQTIYNNKIIMKQMKIIKDFHFYNVERILKQE